MWTFVTGNGNGYLNIQKTSFYPKDNEIEKLYEERLNKTGGIISVRCHKCNAINHRFPKVKCMKCKEITK